MGVITVSDHVYSSFPDIIPEDAAGADLTRCERDCLLVIQELLALSGGIGPSQAEIGYELELSSRSRVNDLVRGLNRKGYIRRLRYRPRAIEVLRPIPMPEEFTVGLLPEAWPALARLAPSKRVPLLGRVS